MMLPDSSLTAERRRSDRSDVPVVAGLIRFRPNQAVAAGIASYTGEFRHLLNRPDLCEKVECAERPVDKVCHQLTSFHLHIVVIAQKATVSR